MGGLPLHEFGNRPAANALFDGSIVALAPVGLELGQSARWDHLDRNLVILAIALLALRRVTQHIAIAQLDADFLGDIGKFGRLGDKKPAAGLLGEVPQQARAARFLRGASAAEYSD